MAVFCYVTGSFLIFLFFVTYIMASRKLPWSGSPWDGGRSLLDVVHNYTLGFIMSHLARGGKSLEDLYVLVASIATVFESHECPWNALIFVLW